MDCGEGTQFRLRDLKLGYSKVRVICISHLHGDHYYGLFGLLDSMALSGRKYQLYLIGPENLRNIIVEMGRANGYPPVYPIHFISTSEVKDRVQVYSDENLTIEAFPLEHGTPCTGFLFRTPPGLRNFRKDKVTQGIPYDVIRKLKKGEDVYDENGVLLYAADEYTYQTANPRTYAYCSDTVYLPDLPAKIRNVDMMYHEATFSEELVEKAAAWGHATARQAALIAREANAGKLLIGHYSSRYKDDEPLLGEARKVFPQTEYAREGETFYI